MPFTANQSYNLLQLTRRSSVVLIGANSPCLYTSIAVRGEVLYCGDIFLISRLFQAWSRGGAKTKTSEGGRIKMSADYYFFAPTGGRYQTVFRGTLPRRCSIKRSRWDNTLTITLHQPYLRRFCISFAYDVLRTFSFGNLHKT